MNYIYSLFIVLLFVPGTALSAQDNNREMTDSIPEEIINIFGLFESNELLEVTLKFDITRFTRKKPQDEYMDGLLTYKFNKTDSINKAIRLRARGSYRYDNCNFPPIRLNFKNTDFGYSDLDSLNNVKLVTHCFNNETYQEYLIREYLVYRIYNILTDYSFRVRFLKINYIDTGKKGLLFEQYAFLIEPLDRLLFRHNAIEIEDVVVGFKNIDPEMMNRIALFQYLIGNSDWYLPMIHNFKIIKRLDQYSTTVMAIPYDFDYSGFVNTHYAVPRDDLNLENITDRYYQGPCRSEDEFRATLDEFALYREEIIDEIRNFEYLDRTIKRELINYVESFYALYKKDTLLKYLLRECKEQKK